VPEYGVAIPPLVQRIRPAPRGRLYGGIAASLLYAAMTAFIPLWWEGYSSASRVVSELSAIDAPTRSLWGPLGFVWAVLMAAFGWGVWESGGGNRPLRVAGGVLLAYGLFNMVPWPPMHQREVLAAGGATLTDTLHLVWSAVTGLFMMTAIGFGAAALGKRFRFYSITTLVLLVALGLVTGHDVPRVQANLPTPLVGVWERLTIGLFLLWIAVLAFALLRRPAGGRP